VQYRTGIAPLRSTAHRDACEAAPQGIEIPAIAGCLSAGTALAAYLGTASAPPLAVRSSQSISRGNAADPWRPAIKLRVTGVARLFFVHKIQESCMNGRATRIDLFSLGTIQMRVFHLAWMAFFVCFFAWFAVAPLMPVIRGDLHLTKDQVANINIAAVCVTIFARLLVGPLCDRYGARLTHTWLLALGAIPVFAIGLSHSYGSFLFFRLCIGAIGASFVITQYHTTTMFAANVVGTANAATAGWGNAGGGVTQVLMPLVLAAIVSVGVEQSFGWRVAMIVPGILMLLVSVLYYRYAQDTPQGNLRDLDTKQGTAPARTGAGKSFVAAARDYRVWMLFITYGACFGIELTIHNLAATYFVDQFSLDVKKAGLYAGSFGLLALFARALGGIVSDRIAHHHGLHGRTALLFALILMEGLGLMLFSRMDSAGTALVAMLGFGLFTHMACGATYSLTPFINPRALGGVAGIIGAGGNVGAVAAGFLMKGTGSVKQGLFILGATVTLSAFCAAAVRFNRDHKSAERKAYIDALGARAAVDGISLNPVTQ
jgi:NNP family nitrate/nitrite transporter-like MFS transporter